MAIVAELSHQLMDAAGVIENLSPIGNIPSTESQARELATLEPEAQRVVWELAKATAPDDEVFVAEDTRLGRKVALKVLPASESCSSATPADGAGVPSV